MWIKKIILENFAPLLTGIQARHVEIDFSTRKNKICLITGPNGHGKTALLSNLTPFATVGNLDIRSSNDMVIRNESGYKEIVIIHNGSEYVIKHYYTPSGDTHTVKSYISRDGEELNSQGTVRSFGFVVSEELGIEPEYLKLIRLGDNVKNLIDLSSTDRKAFLGKLLEELDFYIKAYKKFSNMFTDTKKFMEKAIYRLNRLEFQDMDLLKDEKHKVEKSIDSLQVTVNSLRDKIVSSQAIIKELDPDNSLMARYKKYKHDYDILNAKFKARNEQSFEEAYEFEVQIEEWIEDCNRKLTMATIDLANAKQTRDMMLTDIDNLYKERSELSIKLRQIEEDSDVESAKEIFFKLRVKCNEMENVVGDVVYPYSKEEVENLMVVMNGIQDILDTTYNFGRGPVEKVVKLIRKNRDVHSYINTGLLNLPKNKNEGTAFINKILRYFSFDPSVIADCPNKSCVARMAYNNVRNTFLLESEDSPKEKESEEFLTFMGLAYSNILTVLDRLKQIKDTVLKLPDEYKHDFLSDVLFDKIANLEQVFDISKYNSMLSDITDYEIYQETKDEMKIAEANYNMALKRKNDSYVYQRYEEVNNSITVKESSIQDIKERINMTMTTVDSISKDIKYNTDLLNDYKYLRDLFMELERIKTSVDRIKELQESLGTVYNEYKSMEKELSKFNDRLTKLLVNQDNLKSIKKELKEYQDKYDDLFYLRKASSTKEGIPLEYIEIYLNDAKTLVNELLDIVYDGELYIDDFNVTADEFTISYVKNGHRVHDIISASQGEQSFISTALSSALAYEQLKKYNIQLLDEVDGTLDQGRKEKFIPFLERIMDKTNSEQTFLITHSGIFVSYPVDVVSIVNKKDNSYTFGNFIYVETSNNTVYC